MIPEGSLEELLPDIEAESISYGSTTYRINWVTKTIPGYIDDLEALKQSILCILQTERYEHLIYSYDHGVELDDLIGEDALFITADLHRRVEEALLQDDRIISVESLIIEVKGETIHYRGLVHSIYGELEIDKEVEK